ncbi:MAG: MmgE/PrpD family protein [Pseudomonadota bacterium]
MAATAIETLAQFITTIPRERHPEAAIERAKCAFLDTIGCMVLGTDSVATQAAIAAANGWGTGTAPVYGTGFTLPPPWAAMANGASAHAYDLDDYTLQANDHASAVLVPAVLAASHQPGEDVPGAALLDAYLVGLEVIFRVGEAVNMGHYKLGWHTTSTLDSFGATAAACRLWGLDAKATAAALSLTTSLGSGYVSQFGTSAKPLHAGFSAKTGLVAAGLGRSGATAYMGALDGAVSFSTLLMPAGEARFEASLAKLGDPWGIEEFGLGAKVYPSCGYTHRSIDCAIELHHTLGIQSADEIVSAAASLPDFHLAILPFGVPKDRTEALFSTAYCVALGLVTGSNRIADFTDEAVKREDILSLAGRVDVKSRVPCRPEINLDAQDPDWVEVVLRDGRRGSAQIGIWTGAPGRDLSLQQFENKFRECMSLSGKSVTDQVDEVLEAVSSLDTNASIREIEGALAVSVLARDD